MRLFTCFTVCVRHTMGKIFLTNIYSDLVKIASLPKKDIPCRNWSLPPSSNWKMHPDISLEPREDTLILFTPGPAMGESFRVSKKHFLNQFPSWSTLTICQRYFSTCREGLSSGKSRLKETVGRMNIWCLKMPQTAEPTNGNINNYVCKIVAHCQAGEKTSQHSVIVCLDINWYPTSKTHQQHSTSLTPPQWHWMDPSACSNAQHEAIWSLKARNVFLSLPKPCLIRHGGHQKFSSARVYSAVCRSKSLKQYLEMTQIHTNCFSKEQLWYGPMDNIRLTTWYCNNV